MMSVHSWKNLALVFLAGSNYSLSVSAWVRETAFAWHQFAPSNRRFAINNCRRSRRPLFGSNSPANNGNKNLSAADRERREEEKRRRQRQNDVVVGKTSALRDAQDYALNPKATEEEWLRQASRDEQMVYRLTERGLDSLRMLQLEEANEAFDEVFKIKPDAYLWQAGIARFYLDDVESAANIFAKNAAIYENKFGGPASEERIWRHACELKLLSSLEKKEREDESSRQKIASRLTPIPDRTDDPDSLFAETRKVIRIAGDLFSASVNNDQNGVILARAKLRSIGGNFDDLAKLDIKKWKLSAWFYLGLHYDSIGEVDESKECMKMAMRKCSSGNGDNIIHVLPLMHMSRRDWFDEDDVDANPLQLLRSSVDDSEPPDVNELSRWKDKAVEADPLVSDSIWKSICKMRLFELQNALRVRGKKIIGAKDELKERLYRSLMEDAGLSP